MSGRPSDVFGASCGCRFLFVIASRWPSGDNEKGTLDKKSAEVDKIGAGSRAEEADGTANLGQTRAGFTDPQIDTRRAWFLALVGINVPFGWCANSSQ